jgi:hypothetical protein
MLQSIMTAIGAALTSDPWIIVFTLIVLLLVSVFGNIGINLKEKKITFGSQKTPKKRSCSDCINLLMAKRTAFEVMYNTKQTGILRQQMIFAEHKLTEIELITKKENHPSIKDEIRRSCKENGFVEMPIEDYSRYLEERIDTITSLLNTEDPKIPLIIKEIYDNAKRVKIRIEQEIKKLEEDFIKELDSLIGGSNA